MKYERSILMRRKLPTVEFSPTYDGQLLRFPHKDKQKFHGEYDQLRYNSILETVTALNIPKEIWPYYTVEEDFYQYNSLGYRTHHFDNLSDTFDIAIGCCCVEGLGLRHTETWVHHYEQDTGRQVINLGKGGTGCNYININLLGWLRDYPYPKRVIIFWSDPTTRTVFSENKSFSNLNYGNKRIHPVTTKSDERINLWYNAELQESIISSNEFILTYNNTNIILKNSGITVMNCFPSVYWREEDAHRVAEMTETQTHYINYNNIDGGWATFRDYQYFPAADMTHHGPQHQKPITEQIRKFYENT
jgi:hypothetical protein